MNELLKNIYELIRTVTANVYLEEAPENAKFPIVTYKLTTSIEDFQKEDFILEVNVWNNNTNTLTLEELTENIDNTLHRSALYSNNQVQFNIYRTNRLMIDDPDRKIRRRQLRYVVKAYIF